MSSSMYRGQLDRKRKQRLDAEKKAGEHRAKESAKRNDAAKARQSATKAKSASTATSKLREAERRENEAASAAKSAADWSKKASRYATEEAALATKVTKAEQAEALAASRKREAAQLQTDRAAAVERRALEARVTGTEAGLKHITVALPVPKPEKLRIRSWARRRQATYELGGSRSAFVPRSSQRSTVTRSRLTTGQHRRRMTCSTASRGFDHTSSTSRATAPLNSSSSKTRRTNLTRASS